MYNIQNLCSHLYFINITTHFCNWQIFCCLKNRSVEKSLGSWRCCAAVYWRSGQDGSCSAGVGSLSPNENQMLMNQAIVAGPASEALALKPPLSHTQTHTHTQPPLSFFHSRFILNSSTLRFLTHLFSLCQVFVQVSELQKQAQWSFSSGHILAWPACQDRCCLWKPSGGKNCVLLRYAGGKK